MFKGLFGKKEKNNKLYAPLKGEAVLLENIEDPMFSQKILGDGIAIEPSEGKVYSPADGTVSMIADTLHAIGISTPDGLEVSDPYWNGYSCPERRRIHTKGKSRRFRKEGRSSYGV